MLSTNNSTHTHGAAYHTSVLNFARSLPGVFTSERNSSWSALLLLRALTNSVASSITPSHQQYNNIIIMMLIMIQHISVCSTEGN